MMSRIGLSIDRQKIDSLQAVRTVAFMGVFTSHCGATEWGAWGVSVFIVLSGFLMTVSYYDKTLNPSLKNNINFAMRKISKLYVLHIVTMVVAALLAIVSLRRDYFIKSMLGIFVQIVLNIFMVQSWIPHSYFYFSLNAVAWYLPVCLFAYFVFPFISIRMKSRQIKK